MQGLDRQSRRYRINGKEFSREEAVHAYLPLVRQVARKHYRGLPATVELYDLIHEGIIGLIDALDKYDDARGVKFEVYAVFRINGAIRDALRSLDWVPRKARQTERRLEEARACLEHRLGRAPSTEEIAANSDLTVSDILRIRHRTHCASIRSLDEAASQSDSEVSLVETIRDAHQDVSLPSRWAEAKQELVSAIEALPARERALIVLHYLKGVPMKEIADRWDVSQARISQLRKKAIVRLRKFFQAAMLLEQDQFQGLIA